MTRTAIEMRGASFRYTDRVIFDGLDLRVFYGEVLTVLGSNGCGKSTLLQCLGGALTPNAGTILLDGSDLRDLDASARARKVGFLFQAHQPAFPFTVVDIVLMGRTPYLNRFGGPTAHDRELATETLADIGLLHLKDRAYTELSGGERQLVLLGRVLAQRPKVLLLDEPTAQLDLYNQVRCLKLILLLAGRGIAIVMSSHDPNQAFLLPGRALLMHKDGSVETGIASELINRRSLTSTYGVDVEVYQVPRAAPAGSLTICSPW
jgi:iron complex transport system ATP-binding protein